MLKMDHVFKVACWPVLLGKRIMQNVRNRILSIETKYVGIKFRVLDNVVWRIGKKRQPQTQIKAQTLVKYREVCLIRRSG